MNEILDRLKEVYAELQNKLTDATRKDIDSDAKMAQANKLMADATNKLAYVQAIQREVDTAKASISAVESAKKQLDEAKAFYQEARGLVDKAESIKTDYDKKTAELNQMIAVYRQKNENIENGLADIERRKTVLRAEVMEEFRKKML